MAALRLEMPPRVPRTEYSAQEHWELVGAVSGVTVDGNSPEADRRRAQEEFYRRWDYGLYWSTLINRREFGDLHTRMGHASYAAGGVDLDHNVDCPFSDPEEVLGFDPREAYGPRDRAEIVRRFEEHYAANVRARPDGVNMTGIYVTLVSGLIDIFGWEMLLLAAGTDPERFGKLAGRYASWVLQYFEALAEADVPVVMIHDDIVWTSGPFLQPDWYRRYVFPNYRRLFAPVLDSGKKLLFTSDGNYTEFIDDIVACGVHGLVMEPTTDMAYVAGRYGRRVAFVGNADTRVLLSGSKAEIRAEVERCMAIGKGCPGFVMAVGNHIPPNTPVESALYYNSVYEELSRR
jgi:hypothetical protein